MKDFHSGLTVQTAIGAEVLSANNTEVSIDLQGCIGAEIVLDIGIGGITFTATKKIEFVLTHSDDDVTYTAVTDSDILGATGISNGIVKSLTAAHAAAASYRFGYVGGKRYLRLLAKFSGTHGTGTPIAADVLCFGTINPQADQA